jgi:hypothetical protein
MIVPSANKHSAEVSIEGDIREQADELIEQKGDASGNQPDAAGKEGNQNNSETGGFERSRRRRIHSGDGELRLGVLVGGDYFSR